jgi:WNK lysine deficient protein kinase
VEHSPKGRFIRFNELIGSGAYKLVYRGYDNDTGREIAWVVIKLSRLTLNERRRMVEEILLLKSLNHPNIIGFINQWTVRARNEVVFITELMNGGSLKRYIRKIRRPRLKHIKSWSKAILEGLNYLHSQSIPIVHRDIKCDNIFISASSNEIRIGDLGLAGFTSKAPAIGTPNFMAP